MKFTFSLSTGYRPIPAPGDILEPTPPRRAWYRVVAIRKVKSRVHPNRWMLDVVRADTADTEPRPDTGGYTHLYQ